MTETLGRLRIDRWLWAARFCKTRALAVYEIERSIAQGRPAKQVLHGERAEASTGYTSGDRGAILAMATRGCSAVQTALLCSGTAGCLSRAGVPVLTRVP